MPAWVPNAIAIVLLSAVAVVVYRAAAAIPPSFLDTHFGAGFLPQVLAIILALLTVGLTVETLVRPASTGERSGKPELRQFFRPVTATLILVAYIAALDAQWLPFFVTSFAFVFSLGLLLSGGGIRALVVSSIVAMFSVGFVQVVFTRIFTVFLP